MSEWIQDVRDHIEKSCTVIVTLTVDLNEQQFDAFRQHVLAWRPPNDRRPEDE